MDGTATIAPSRSTSATATHAKMVLAVPMALVFTAVLASRTLLGQTAPTILTNATHIRACTRPVYACIFATRSAARVRWGGLVTCVNMMLTSAPRRLVAQVGVALTGSARTRVNAKTDGMGRIVSSGRSFVHLTTSTPLLATRSERAVRNLVPARILASVTTVTQPLMKGAPVHPIIVALVRRVYMAVRACLALEIIRACAYKDLSATTVLTRLTRVSRFPVNTTGRVRHNLMEPILVAVNRDLRAPTVLEISMNVPLYHVRMVHLGAMKASICILVHARTDGQDRTVRRTLQSALEIRVPWVCLSAVAPSIWLAYPRQTRVLC